MIQRCLMTLHLRDPGILRSIYRKYSYIDRHLHCKFDVTECNTESYVAVTAHPCVKPISHNTIRLRHDYNKKLTCSFLLLARDIPNVPNVAKRSTWEQCILRTDDRPTSHFGKFRTAICVKRTIRSASSLVLGQGFACFHSTRAKN